MTFREKQCAYEHCVGVMHAERVDTKAVIYFSASQVKEIILEEFLKVNVILKSGAAAEVIIYPKDNPWHWTDVIFIDDFGKNFVKPELIDKIEVH